MMELLPGPCRAYQLSPSPSAMAPIPSGDDGATPPRLHRRATDLAEHPVRVDRRARSGECIQCEMSALYYFFTRARVLSSVFFGENLH